MNTLKDLLPSVGLGLGCLFIILLFAAFAKGSLSNKKAPSEQPPGKRSYRDIFGRLKHRAFIGFLVYLMAWVLLCLIIYLMFPNFWRQIRLANNGNVFLAIHIAVVVGAMLYHFTDNKVSRLIIKVTFILVFIGVLGSLSCQTRRPARNVSYINQEEHVRLQRTILIDKHWSVKVDRFPGMYLAPRKADPSVFVQVRTADGAIYNIPPYAEGITIPSSPHYEYRIHSSSLVETTSITY